jgi:hypothetical protein
MKILVPALQADKPTLRKMLTTYLVELSQYTTIDLEYLYLDTYWQPNQARWPYLVQVENQAVGFVLVNTWSPPAKERISPWLNSTSSPRPAKTAWVR